MPVGEVLMIGFEVACPMPDGVGSPVGVVVLGIVVGMAVGVFVGFLVLVAVG